MMSDFSGSSVSGVYGTVLNRGLVLKSSGELGSVYNIRLDSSYWAQLPDAAMSPASTANVKKYMASNLTGLQVGKVDGLSLYNADLRSAKTPVLVMMEADEQKIMVTSSDQYGFGGGLGKVIGHRTDVSRDAWYFGTHYFDLDNYPDLVGRSYEFASLRHAAKTSLADVYQASAFGVKADGATDDAAALQKALDTAGAAGGGTVLLPHGTTLVKSPLHVPSGVELRGGNLPVPLRPWLIVCCLLLAHGQDTTQPATAEAGITLADHAGLRGIDICDATNLWQLDSSGMPAVHAYPFDVRGSGKDIYVYDSCFTNAYNMIDFGSNRCDGAQVVNLWGCAVKTGIFIGGGSANVQLENVSIDIGPLGSDPHWNWHFDSKIRNACQDILSRESTTFIFGDSTKLSTFHLSGFAPHLFMQFIDQGNGGATDAAFWSSIFDVPAVETVRLSGAHSVDFLGLFATGGGDGHSNCFEADPSFTGKVNFYGPCQQTSFCNHPDKIGVEHLQIHLEHSLTTGRKVVDVSSVEAGSAAQNALDGKPDTFWASKDVPGIHSLTVQLDEPSIATRFRLHCAGDYLGKNLNTSDATLEGSMDGQTFFELASFKANTKNWVDMPVDNASPVMFVRLLVGKPEQPGQVSNRSFVANFDVFGYPARQAQSTTPASAYAQVRDWATSVFDFTLDDGWQHFEKGQYEEAGKAFASCQLLGRGIPAKVAAALYGAGRVSKATGKDAEARTAFVRALNLLSRAKAPLPADRDWPGFTILNADILVSIDRGDDAADLLQNALSIAPDSAKAKIQARIDILKTQRKQ